MTVNGGTLDLNDFSFTTPTFNGTGGTVDLGASGVLTVNGATANSYAGTITGGGSLTKRGNGTLTLTGANTYTGGTTIVGGTLALDFSGAGGPASNLLASSSTLNLSGGTLHIVGANGETNSQSFATTNVTAGSNTLRADSGTGGNATLNLGSINRSGGLANFILPSSGAITTTNADGLLGGWATINGTDYAKVLGGAIVALDATDYTTKDDAGTWLDGEIISDADGNGQSFSGTIASSIQIGGLKYSEPSDSTVIIAGGNQLAVDGTILVAPSVLDPQSGHHRRLADRRRGRRDARHPAEWRRHLHHRLHDRRQWRGDRLREGRHRNGSADQRRQHLYRRHHAERRPAGSHAASPMAAWPAALARPQPIRRTWSWKAARLPIPAVPMP